jgi:hypothetical protein
MVCLRRLASWCAVVLAMAGCAAVAVAQEGPGSAESGPLRMGGAAQARPAQAAVEPAAQAHEPLLPVSQFDAAIFQKRVPADQLAVLKSVTGGTTGDAWRDRQFKKVIHNALPDCMFHYGRDRGLNDSVDIVLDGSRVPVKIRDGRYMTLAGANGPYLEGRGMVWVDLQEGIVLGAFYFHPTNGEPTPTVTVFSRQVKEDVLSMSELPPEFAEDLARWSEQFRVPAVTTRYFITGSNKRILLEHDEDFCTVAGSECEQMNADAADIDLNTAYYLEQVHYATNATAWMIVGEEQGAWVRVRDNTCRVGIDPLGCRIRMTREHTHVIIHRVPRKHV